MLTFIWAWVFCQVPCGTGEVRQWHKSGGCFYAFRLPSGLPPFLLFPCCTSISTPVSEIDLTALARRGNALFKEAPLLTN